MSTYDDWASAVGATLEADGHAPWTVTACSPATDAAGWRSWSVTLHSPEPVDQTTAAIHLPGLEPEPVFVVPSGRDADGTTLVASFTTPIEPAPDTDGAS